MEFMSVPIIVLICYMVAEVYKVMFKKKEELYKLIPILVGVVGGIIGVIIYYTEPKLMFNTKSVWLALGMGIVSGFSSAGTNQIIKQMKGKEKEDEKK